MHDSAPENDQHCRHKDNASPSGCTQPAQVKTNDLDRSAEEQRKSQQLHSERLNRLLLGDEGRPENHHDLDDQQQREPVTHQQVGDAAWNGGLYKGPGDPAHFDEKGGGVFHDGVFVGHGVHHVADDLRGAGRRADGEGRVGLRRWRSAYRCRIIPQGLAEIIEHGCGGVIGKRRARSELAAKPGGEKPEDVVGTHVAFSFRHARLPPHRCLDLCVYLSVAHHFSFPKRVNGYPRCRRTPHWQVAARRRFRIP